jgi:signal transduction histidine kinase
MEKQTRDWIAGAIVAISLAVSLVVLLFGGYDPGFSLAPDNGGLVVSQVSSFSQAARDGVDPGMRVVTLNDRQLIRLPAYNYPEPDPDNPEQAPDPILVGPSTPTPVQFSDDELFRLSKARIDRADLIREGDLQDWQPEGSCCILSVYYPGPWSVSEASLALIPGLAILFGGIWWLSRGRGGDSLRPVAIAASAAAATPLLVIPMLATVSPGLVVLGGLLTVAGMIPLALGLAERIEDPADRRLNHAAIGALAVVGVVSVIFHVTGGTSGGPDVGFLRWASIGAIPLVPGLAAAGPVDFSGLRAVGTSTRRLLQSTEFALAGATPLFALATDRSPYIWPIAAWLGAIAVAGRFTVRPLARLATRAQLQRDLIVAATEAERARLAADIHDEALQELTLLVRRLETAGDTEGAELGRTVADRLRAICGDLRLPILDDLGVGPALDWLVLRIERLAGGEVRLERTDGTRPPPDVELAIFRVAQEALANAVKHGRPPIVVRYRATDSGVSLSIDDAGPGIDANAGTAAEQGGHFGLLNMQQRAEAIGAILDIRRWPSGGTHVALEWRQR